MPKSMSDRAGDMLLGATFAASLGAVAFLLKLRKGNGKGTDESVKKAILEALDEARHSHPNIKLPHQHERKMQERMRLHAVEDDLHSEGPERRKVTVRVPATSANLGPGYDTIGMALDMWSEITVERADRFEIVAEGEGADDVPKDESNLVVTGMKAAFAAAKKPMPLLKYHCINRIPYARGLGSSSAAIVAGLIAGLVLAGHQLPCWGSEELLQLAACIEGHPDNVAPAIYGGIQLGIHTGERWTSERVNTPPGIQLVLFIPDFIGKTSDARGVLDSNVERKDAVYNIGRVAWLVNALSTSNLDNLRFGVEDALHQPQRGKAVYKHLYPLIEAANAAGANGCFLSGAGPTVMAITSGASGDIFAQRLSERVDWTVAEAMVRTAEAVGVKGQVYITSPAEHGAQVVSAEPAFSSKVVRFKGDV
ncbi:hypothetical protein NSK_004755 [Nannochloropsis salina CCMP1776]|uniref:Homoserine kinase n=1 Tax=Nannochloropsis salina CCMP1776 TaxID=1027361 RepID=A0A4D9CWF4_9STRA|nr:hypothetical protein NSK_004755 [Nannochloropsis salina CCMP1776]|eukprot:TFJ83651.1 hypothetical protein NSK_004755 [Nannochloropsis salina CCMP1776]